MEKVSHKTARTKLRRSLQDVICSVEIIMTGIHGLLGEMGTLVQQIDRTAERIEVKARNRLNQKDVVLDANQNRCEKTNTPPLNSSKRTPPRLAMDYTNSKETVPSPFMDNTHSKQTLPSPFMDYTYLELMSNCEICDNHMGRFTYNEKYPLWIQYDTWRTGNTTSDISLVSGGSDVTNTRSESNNNSWKSARIIEDNLKNNKISKFRQNIENGDKVERFDICCNGENSPDGHYCGVYEQIMEDLLESECLSCNTSRHENDECFDNLDTSEAKSNYSLSLSDEHVLRYNNTLNTWTAYNTENAFIESSCSTCS